MKNVRLTKRGKVIATILAIAIALPLSVKIMATVFDLYFNEVETYQQQGADYAEEMREVRYQTLTLQEKMTPSENQGSTRLSGKSPGTDDGMSRNGLSSEVSFDQSKGGLMPMIV